jgi:hypothetical protein
MIDDVCGSGSYVSDIDEDSINLTILKATLQ